MTTSETQASSGWGKLWKAVKATISRVAAAPEMEDWWLAAQGQMEDYVKSAQKKGEEIKPVIYQIFGHTHRADAREKQDTGLGVTYRYLNPGTWSGGVDQGGYMVVDEEGRVRLHDWINEPPQMRPH